MKSQWLMSLGAAALLVAALASTAILPFGFRSKTPAATVSATPAEPPSAEHPPEEIFRRAFWRHPTAADTIIHADRHEVTDPAGNVQHWQWFLQVEPGAELLRALKDPAKFGLARVATARVPDRLASAPEWFPSDAEHAGLEILQVPPAGLLVLYREDGNVLFATDAGGGFAPPAVSTSGIDF